MFYFAWVDETDLTFNATHEVVDENMFSIAIAHHEGEHAELSIDIKNPKIGLLNAGRKTWAILSYKKGAAETVPLFVGRIIGVPEKISETIVRVSFLARPPDWDEQREILAEAMRILPYYDPLWIAPDRREDPDAVLEGYTSLWHTDRVTLEVTASNIINGEDGVLDLGKNFFRDSLQISYNSIPSRAVAVEATVTWDQHAVGDVDIAEKLIEAFQEEGTGSNYHITTFTGEGLIRDWPEKDKSIGAGWKWGECSAERLDGGALNPSLETVIFSNLTVAKFPLWKIKPTLIASYDVSRRREEKLSFTLAAATQPLVTEVGDQEVIQLSLSSADVASPIDEGDALPIGDRRRRSFFPTDRGQQSVNNLLAIARTRLLMRSRAVSISFACSWELGLELNCRKNVRIEDKRIPGGEATGKVVGYILTRDVDGAKKECLVQLACTIGTGETVSEVEGNPVYVDDYVDGYQILAGEVVMPIPGEVTFNDFSDIVPNDDGVDFFNMNPETSVISVVVTSGEDVQREVIQEFRNDIQEAANALNQVFTFVDVVLKPLSVNETFITEYPITVSSLMIPKTIDLEAGAI